MMTLVSQHGRAAAQARWALAILGLALAASGCGRGDVRVYNIPKERAPGAPWTVPAGWEERDGGGMRVARFAVRGSGDATADVAVIPLNLAASRADILNVWREQIKLPPLDDAALGGQAKTVSVGSASAELFEMVSDEPVLEDKSRARVLVALLRNENTTWILKMSGSDELVSAQKPGFLSFLESVRVDDLASYKPASPRVAGGRESSMPRATAARPQWTVPSGWNEIPNPQMLLAKFRVTGADGASVDVNVSVEQGDGGGLLGNINRWRGQLGLAPADAAELARLTTDIKLPDGRASVVEFSGTNAMNGQPARIIGAVVSRDGQTWFYKLMGHEQLAAREREAFLKFFQTAKYPNG